MPSLADQFGSTAKLKFEYCCALDTRKKVERLARCLVVGGNGFVGSHLVDVLVEKGHQVSVLDRFSGGVEHFERPGVTKFIGDFLNLADIRTALQGVDYLFHFLSTTTPATAEDDPLLDLRTNVIGSVELFREAALAGVERIYFASSGGSIYGDHEMESVSENVIPQPTSPYAIGKLALESYLRYFERKYAVEVVSFRISNPYGPRQRSTKQGVIPIFLRAALNQQPIRIYGDGTMIRDYIYVKDAVRLIADTIDVTHAERLLNIGSGVGSSILEVVDTINSVTGQPLLVEKIDTKATFVQKIVLDTTKCQQLVGEQSLIGLHEGIELTWSDLLRSEGK